MFNVEPTDVVIHVGSTVTLQMEGSREPTVSSRPQLPLYNPTMRAEFALLDFKYT
jgi:hypothetical protein